MCDYSLHHVAWRPAKVGDKLLSTGFSRLGTRSFAAGEPNRRWRTAVEHYVGIDVSLELLSVCVVDGRGKIVKEAKVASEPEALVYFLKELGFPVNRIGFVISPR